MIVSDKPRKSISNNLTVPSAMLPSRQHQFFAHTMRIQIVDVQTHIKKFV